MREDGEPSGAYPELFRCRGLVMWPGFDLGAVLISTRLGGDEHTVWLDPYQARDLFLALRPLVEEFAPIGPAER